MLAICLLFDATFWLDTKPSRSFLVTLTTKSVRRSRLVYGQFEQVLRLHFMHQMIYEHEKSILFNEYL